MVAPFTFLIYLQHGVGDKSRVLSHLLLFKGFHNCSWIFHLWMAPLGEKSHCTVFAVQQNHSAHWVFLDLEFNFSRRSPRKKGDQWPPTLAGPPSLFPHMAPHRPTDVGLLAGPFCGLLSPLASVAAGRPKRWQPVKKFEQVHLRDAHDDVPFRVRRHRRGKRTFLHSVDDFISFLLATTEFFSLLYLCTIAIPQPI